MDQKTSDVVSESEENIILGEDSNQPLPVKRKPTLLIILAILAVVLPLSIWTANQMISRPPKAASLPLASVRINPELITTKLKGNTVYLSALAYDTGGFPIFSNISYQWGISTTYSIGKFIVNGTTNLASFMPSATVQGRGDIWVTAFDTNGQQVKKSIPVYVGVTATPTPTNVPTLIPTKIPIITSAPASCQKCNCGCISSGSKCITNPAIRCTQQLYSCEYVNGTCVVRSGNGNSTE